MRDDADLDDRIRTMLGAAIADAPAAPRLTRIDPACANRVRRRWIVVAAPVAAAAATLVAVAIVRDDGTRRMHPISTPSVVVPTTDVVPDDHSADDVVAVSLRPRDTGSAQDVWVLYNDGASGRRATDAVGIALLAGDRLVFSRSDRIVVARFDDPSETIVAQGDDLELQDAAVIEGVLRIAYLDHRVDGRTELLLWSNGDTISLGELPDGWAVGHRRFRIGRGGVGTSWVNDTGQSGTTSFDFQGRRFDGGTSCGGGCQALANGLDGSSAIVMGGTMTIDASNGITGSLDLPANVQSLIDIDVAGDRAAITFTVAGGKVTSLIAEPSGVAEWRWVPIGIGGAGWTTLPRAAVPPVGISPTFPIVDSPGIQTSLPAIVTAVTTA